jgi:GntR family transcriptional repressor for pyruvate dehydrogenase complex
MVSALFYEQRRKTVHHGRDLKDAAQMHRNIYHAIRAHDAKRARASMSEHLALAQQAQALEATPRPSAPPVESSSPVVPSPSAPAASHAIAAARPSDRLRPRLVQTPVR